MMDSGLERQEPEYQWVYGDNMSFKDFSHQRHQNHLLKIPGASTWT